MAILDSGVDASHPDVGPIQGYVRIFEDDNRKLVYDTEPHEDSFGHGTACRRHHPLVRAGLRIDSVKVLGTGLSGSGRIFAAGLQWAIDNGMQVCNLSLGTTKRDFFGVFHELADLAYFKHVTLVTAADNIPIPSFPSVFASVLSVRHTTLATRTRSTTIRTRQWSRRARHRRALVLVGAQAHHRDRQQLRRPTYHRHRHEDPGQSTLD